MALQIALMSGEPSGDATGAALVRAIRELQPDATFWGMASHACREAGVEIVFDSAEWSAIGYIEAIKLYPRLRFIDYPRILQEIDRRRPDVVVLIDFGTFNMKILRWCAAKGIPTVYYFPPGSWRQTGEVGGDLARLASHIATPFPWSAERLKAAGARVTFVGHPLLERAKPSLSKIDFCDRFGLDDEQPIIGLLPGSRGFEVEHNTPAMLGAAELIREQLPGAQFVFGVASASARKVITAKIKNRQAVAAVKNEFEREERKVREAAGDMRPMVTPEGVLIRPYDLESNRKRVDPLPLVLAENLTYDVMAHSNALIVCSGTATLEAAIIGTPMVIIYRGSKLMEIEYKVRRLNRLEHIGMPNIIAGRRIVPELIQHDATPEALAGNIVELMSDLSKRAELKAELANVRQSLGEPGASEKTAEIVLRVANEKPSPVVATGAGA
jgi:lipid-A-disaccharide synthase